MMETWKYVFVVVVGMCVWLAEGNYVHQVGDDDVHENAINHNPRYNKHRHQQQPPQQKLVKEASRMPGKEHWPEYDPSGASIVLGLARALIGALKGDECIERILCEVGYGISRVDIARVLMSVLMGYVTPEYTRYVVAMQGGVMRTSDCNFYCSVLLSRDEL